MATQERAIRTRNALIKAAAELLDQEGPAPVSLATISAKAGVSNGALHFHFPNKAALLDAVVVEAEARLRQITRPRDLHTVQALIDATHDLVRALGRNVVLRVGFRLSGRGERSEAAPDLWGDWQQWVEATLARADGEGALVSDPSPEELAAVVVAVGAGLQARAESDARWLERGVLTQFWALLLPRIVGSAARHDFSPAGFAPASGEDQGP
ncbi:TetR/AcrR family transcriptional regulator [Streptomyces phaeolivaceus]|uniref:TetR/AcrR family transcriptional regulator n=1 Tax=Streptomyces phaeolivaceus TaxID=2653200 RepID=A0A5P8K569_9ACTN|nr:ScbR family autoregulator-binding transcription factor [Streptomyces phaeolivaceus]QFQ97777.1 TetR/AcrR family transcriptional regulator [Streptomyces phaeolivaceus]